MCRIYGVVTNINSIGSKINRTLEHKGDSIKKYIIRVGESAPVITSLDNPQLEYYTYGYTSSDSKHPMLLAVAPKEKLILNSVFKNSIRMRRCLIPATHFIAIADKIPFCIHLLDERQFFMAGIWDTWTEPESEEDNRSFAIITCEANKVLCSYGINRMPVILSPGNASKWLRKDLPLSAALHMSIPINSERLDIYPICEKTLNNRAINDVSVLSPIDKSYRTIINEMANAEVKRKRERVVEEQRQKAEREHKSYLASLKARNIKPIE